MFISCPILESQSPLPTSLILTLPFTSLVISLISAPTLYRLLGL